MGGKLLKFELIGRMGCFKKYYSNKNVLSYYLPPRTTIMGILASILMLDKDSYYEMFDSKNINIGVQINKESKVHVTPLNHLKARKGKKDKSDRTQVRHEFLLPKDDKISFFIYLYFKSFKYEKELIDKIMNKNFGYGISLGQKQFKGYINNTELISSYEFIDDYNGEINSLTSVDNVININSLKENIIIKELMPINFKEIKDGREPLEYGEVIYDKKGKPIMGNFRKVLKVNDKYISFFKVGD